MVLLPWLIVPLGQDEEQPKQTPGHALDDPAQTRQK